MHRQATASSASRSDLSAEKLALCVISEEGAMPLDQLARFLAADRSQAEALVDEFTAKRFVRQKVFFEGDAPWVWLTRKGASKAGTGLAHRGYPPDHAYLNHRRAVNEVRLWLERREPAGSWTSESALEGRRPRGSQIPDGVFEVDRERHAIEVELSSKTRRAYRHVLNELSERYDAIVYFCSPATLRLLEQLQQEGSWPKLVVRPVPGFKKPGRRQRLNVIREPSSEEKVSLRLLTEQGAVRVDQLARFLSCDEAATLNFVAQLEKANFVTRYSFLKDEPAWVGLTWIGNRLADTPLDWFRPRLGGVKEWHGLNEIRLHISSRAPDAKWISRRSLRAIYGRSAKVPGAEIQFGGQRYAANLRLTPNNGATLVARTDLHNAKYDAVIFFCATPRARLFMERLLERYRWSKVVIRDLPRPESFLHFARPVDEVVGALLDNDR
jgi:hypothetical protein